MSENSDKCMEDLILAIVRNAAESDPVTEDELVRCGEWCANRETDAAAVRSVRKGLVAIHWPEGAAEPTFTLTAAGRDLAIRARR